MAWQNNKKLKKGFTLVEALIALFVFMIITIILMNIYIITIRSERVAYTILRDGNIVQNTLESMARSIRMGIKFDLKDNGAWLEFETDEEGQKFDTAFRYNKNTKKIERARYLNRDDFISLIPDNINIEDFKFEIKGDSEEGQISILIKFSIVSNVYNNDYKTFIQTVVTPRSLTTR